MALRGRRSAASLLSNAPASGGLMSTTPPASVIQCRLSPPFSRACEIADRAPNLANHRMPDSSSSTPARPKRRPRYPGKHPRRFEEKYKEHDPRRYKEVIAKVMASGKTPAGTHGPTTLGEHPEILRPDPAEIAVRSTLGCAGHAQETLPRHRSSS